MGGKDVAVKKYVVRLSADEREKLSDFIRSGRRDVTFKQMIIETRAPISFDVGQHEELSTGVAPTRRLGNRVGR